MVTAGSNGNPGAWFYFALIILDILVISSLRTTYKGYNTEDSETCFISGDTNMTSCNLCLSFVCLLPLPQSGSSSGHFVHSVAWVFVK